MTRCALEMYVRSVQYISVQYSVRCIKHMQSSYLCSFMNYFCSSKIFCVFNHPDALATALADAEAGPPFDWAVALACALACDVGALPVTWANACALAWAIEAGKHWGLRGLSPAEAEADARADANPEAPPLAWDDADADARAFAVA